MRCQACEKNETSTVVICDACREHYAAIREGQYLDHDLAFGEARLVIHSWVAVPATKEKKKAREDKVAHRRSMFAKPVPAVPAPAEEEAPLPPPDWKNRVFPVPDEPAAAPAARVPAPAVEAAPVDETPAGETDAAVYELPVSEPAVALPDELPTSEAVEAPSFELPEADPAPAYELPDAAEASVAMPEPPPELATFFETISGAPAGVVEAETAAGEVQDFFESLGAAAPEAAVEAEPAADLSGFFDSLAAPPAPAEAPVAAPEPTVAPEAPASPSPVKGLDSFFASLAAPAPEAPGPAPTSAPATGAGIASLLDGLLAETAKAEAEPTPPAAAPAAPAADLNAFFASLAAPQPTEPEAPAAPVAPAAPAWGEMLANLGAPAEAPAATDTEAALAAFSFDLPQTAAPQAPVFVAEAEVAAAPPPSTEQAAATLDDEGRKPFSIELELPTLPAAGRDQAPRRALDDLKPPMHGQPFTIELGAPSPPPTAPKRNPEALELKRQHSTGELSFVHDEDEEAPGGGSLFEGLSFGGHADDDDDERTIEL